MDIASISWIGWVHTFASLVALAVGAGAIAARKGSARHSWRGNVYFCAMVAGNLTALSVYSQRAFGVFHWMALAALALVGIGRYAATRQNVSGWAYAHPIAMILSYYLLVGGAVNEAFVRVEAVRSLGEMALGITHGIVALAFLLVIAFVAGRVAGLREKRGAMPEGAGA